MISIHESSGLVHVSYTAINGCDQLRGSGATLGLQAAGGSGADAAVVGVNAPVLDDNRDHQSMSFQPSS